jgi:RHS repeat-associated protein
VLQEQRSSNVTRYLYGAGMMAVQQNGAWMYQHTDALGSVRQTTNILGVVQQSVDYDPFDNVLRAVGQPNGTGGLVHEQQDAAPRLTFLRARYYDPTIGRFLTRDTYLRTDSACCIIKIVIDPPVHLAYECVWAPPALVAQMTVTSSGTDRASA